MRASGGRNERAIANDDDVARLLPDALTCFFCPALVLCIFAQMSVPKAKSSVTVEDAGSDDDFSLSEDDTALSPAAASAAKSVKQQQPVRKMTGESGQDNTNRGALSPGVESQFEVWLRKHVNEPLLNVLPEWVTPNSISYVNTGVCWCAFLCSYIAYKYEHLYPWPCMMLRFLMGALVSRPI